MIDWLIESERAKIKKLNENANKVKYEEAATVIKEYEDIICIKKKNSIYIFLTTKENVTGNLKQGSFRWFQPSR